MRRPSLPDARQRAKLRLLAGAVGLSVAAGFVHIALAVAVFSVYLVLDGLFLAPTDDR